MNRAKMKTSINVSREFVFCFGHNFRMLRGFPAFQMYIHILVFSSGFCHALFCLSYGFTHKKRQRCLMRMYMAYLLMLEMFAIES
ncbi:CLUMA_CG009135, isoform A [Clunio marinus]|uniref:CLUMA_CG009135, isoform A n=1 Tax=Clunio marinus TaxID=568069 RepID=A0A1J1I5V7_9DIPT|nr:CLUMA_CG009135, isoform A [Clunio marinus]